MQDSQDEETSTDKAQSTREYKKKSRWKQDIFLFFLNCSSSFISSSQCTFKHMETNSEAISIFIVHLSRQVSRGVPADAGFFCDETTLLRGVIKGTFCVCVRGPYVCIIIQKSVNRLVKLQ
jgi:hypothetical protein